MAKAFDTVYNSKILYKLQYYVIKGDDLNWHTSYISNRCQCIKIINIYIPIMYLSLPV